MSGVEPVRAHQDLIAWGSRGGHVLSHLAGDRQHEAGRAEDLGLRGALLREMSELRDKYPASKEMIDYFESEILRKYPDYRGSY